MTRKAIRNPGTPSRPAASATAPAPAFEPAQPRPRHDGWTPERQVAFIEALAECGCVDEACARVGMSRGSAYDLRRREDAESFRTAWDLALDHAIQRLSDAVFARALHGVVRPVFYKGEQVGERRYFDERLAMFLLRHRDPLRYGAWRDACEATRDHDGAARDLGEAIRRLADPARRGPARPGGTGHDRPTDTPWSPGSPLLMARPDPHKTSRHTVVRKRMTDAEAMEKLGKLVDAKTRALWMDEARRRGMAV